MGINAKIRYAKSTMGYWKNIIEEMQAGNWEQFSAIDRAPVASSITRKDLLPGYGAWSGVDGNYDAAYERNDVMANNRVLGGGQMLTGQVGSITGEASDHNTFDGMTNSFKVMPKWGFSTESHKFGLYKSGDERRRNYLRERDSAAADSLSFDEIMANSRYTKGSAHYSKSWDDHDYTSTKWNPATGKLESAPTGQTRGEYYSENPATGAAAQMLTVGKQMWEDKRNKWLADNPNYSDEEKAQVEANYAKNAAKWNEGISPQTEREFRQAQYEKAVSRFRNAERLHGTYSKRKASQSSNFFSSGLGKVVTLAAAYVTGGAASGFFAAGTTAAAVAGGAAAGATIGGLGAAGAGGDILGGIVKGGLIGGATAGLADIAAPYVSEGLDAAGDYLGIGSDVAQVGQTVAQDVNQNLINAGLPIDPTANFATVGGQAGTNYVTGLVEAGLPLSGDALATMTGTSVPDSGGESFADTIGEKVGEELGDAAGDQIGGLLEEDSSGSGAAVAGAAATAAGTAGDNTTNGAGNGSGGIFSNNDKAQGSSFERAEKSTGRKFAGYNSGIRLNRAASGDGLISQAQRRL